MELIEKQAHEANLKANYNRVMARLYLYCLKNNYNPVDATMCNNEDIKRTTISFGINRNNVTLLDKLVSDCYETRLLDLVKIEKIEDRLFLTIGALENDNGNILMGYLLRKLFSYKDVELESNDYIKQLYDMNKEGLIDYHLTVIKLEEDAYEVYKEESDVLVEQTLAFSIEELKDVVKRLNSFNLQIRRK